MSLAGLRLNLEKGALLLPISAPLPTAEVRELFPPQFEFHHDGIRIAGSPIGTDAFMQSFVHEKVAEAETKLETIAQVGKKIPSSQATHHVCDQINEFYCCYGTPSYNFT